MVSSKTMYLFPVIMSPFLALVCVSAQDSSPTPTSILPRDDSDLYSSAYDFPFVLFDEVFRKLLQISLRNFADVQRFLHLNVSDFSAEACASKENSGPCEIFGFDSFINGNETCLIYTIGSCNEEFKRFTDRGCTHWCKLPTAGSSGTESTTISTTDSGV